MNSPLTLTVCLGILVGFGLGQSGTGSEISLQPTPLESFARLPTTHVAWSTEVGRIESREAHATITALVLQDTAQPPDRLRGIRVDVSENGRGDKIYLGEETLGSYKKAFDEISRSLPDFRRGPRDDLVPGGTSCLGAEMFWYGDNTPRVHTLAAAYCIESDSAGMELTAFRGTRFHFPDSAPSTFSEIIARAIDQLARH
jgi:hypothetical protein